ncbi:hypothetical protein quinque_010359 [Culex quinquefasciatus]
MPDQLRQPGPLHHRKHQPEEVEPLSANNRIQLTQQVYDREVICNRSHPDHSVLTKRDKAFDEVTREQGMSMPELKHHWRTGKIVTKINNTIATIISTPAEVEPEDYIDDGKAGGVITCITSKSICKWGSDPHNRIPQTEVKSKSKKSIH